LSANLDFGATVPALRPIAVALLTAAALLSVGGSVLIAVTARPRNRTGS